MYYKILTIILMIFLSSANAKKSHFTGNEEAIKSLQTIYVLTDTTLVEELKKNQRGLNLAYNQNLGKELFANLVKYFDGLINAELIHSVASVGLYHPENVYLPDYLDSSHKIILPVIDETIINSDVDEYIQVLNPLVDRSFAIVKSRKERKNYLDTMFEKDFTRIQRLGLQQGESVLLIIAAGTKVPTQKSVEQGIATAILTLGLFSSWEISANQFNAVLISHDGKLLWTDAYFKSGKVTKDKKQKSFIKRLFKHFPVKMNKRK